MVAKNGDLEHRDHLNVDSSISRERWLRKLAAKLEMDADDLANLVEQPMTELAREADENAEPGGDAAERESNAATA